MRRSVHHTTVLRNSLCSKYDCIDATDNLESDPSCEIAYLTELYCRLPVVSWRTRKCPWSQMSGIFQISDHGDCRSQSCSAARQGTYHGLDRNAGHKSDKSRFHLSRKKHSESLYCLTWLKTARPIPTVVASSRNALETPCPDLDLLVSCVRHGTLLYYVSQVPNVPTSCLNLFTSHAA